MRVANFTVHSHYRILMNYSNQVAERLDGVSQGVNPAAVSS